MFSMFGPGKLPKKCGFTTYRVVLNSECQMERICNEMERAQPYGKLYGNATLVSLINGFLTYTVCFRLKTYRTDKLKVQGKLKLLAVLKWKQYTWQCGFSDAHC